MDIEKLKENLEFRPFFVRYVKANMEFSQAGALEQLLKIKLDTETSLKLLNEVKESMRDLITKLEELEFTDMEQMQYVFDKVCEFYVEKIKERIF